MKARRTRRLGGSALRVALIVTIGIAGALAYVTQPTFRVVPRPFAARADPLRLRSHVEELASTLAPRSALMPGQLERTVRYLHEQFVASGAEVRLQEVPTERGTFRNVVASLGAESQERIVVGAHYDAAGPAIGADDNASGVAGMLELARLARANPPPIRLELVAFSTEEPPYFRTRSMGSFVHAGSLRASGVALRAMICLEMIGYFRDEPGSQHDPVPGLQWLHGSAGDFIAVVGCIGQASLARRVKLGMAATVELPVISMNAPRRLAGIDFSDHLNYWDAGFPAVMVTDTAFYRNPNYHEATDTPDTLDYERMARVVDGVFGAIHRLAE